MPVRFFMKEIASGLLLGFLGILVSASLMGGEPSLVPESSKFQMRRPGWTDGGVDSWWTRDKRLHLVVSAGMVGLSFHLLHDRWHYEVGGSRRLALSLTALAGVIKEVSDKRKKPPTSSSKDLVADGLGILLGVLLFTR